MSRHFKGNKTLSEISKYHRFQSQTRGYMFNKLSTNMSSSNEMSYKINSVTRMKTPEKSQQERIQINHRKHGRRNQSVPV